MLLGSLREAGLRVRDALTARPATEGPWDALRHAFRAIVDHLVYPVGDMEAIARISLDTPSIRARDLEKYQQWEALLAPDVARRLEPSGQHSGTTGDERARAIIGCVIACLRLATERWLRSTGAEDPAAILDDLIDTVGSS